ncbi:DUF3772 domain-containing protein [Vannielia sp.]|uniref:DUF3772 domain-containing protein n=1 Tax=Vannielia sp. TaxID=2813045 RepID=UPI00260E877B|nr:DUF3772 domain-containing protein [Vannielia sp.]MDF1873680.1 DUF3772 domain-containing protein [Vannielia sp.]
MRRIALFVLLLGLGGPVVAQSTVGDMLTGGGEAATAEPAATSSDEAVVEPVPEGEEPAQLSLPGGPDYTAWERAAEQAEQVLDADRASTLALEQMRARLVTWRSTFNEVQSANSAKIERLTAQLEALGPAPAEGESEAEVLAKRRAAINAELTRLLVPIRAADEAWTRADGLISEVDTRLRMRQTKEVLETNPSPLYPANWVTPLEDLWESFNTLREDFQKSWSNDTQLADLRRNTPLSALIAVIGLVLMVWGRNWSLQIVRRLMERGAGEQRTMIVAMLASLGQLVLPQLGLVALVIAISTIGLEGILAVAVLSAVPVMGMLIFGARWLGNHSFPKTEILPAPLSHDEASRKRGRLYALMAGVALALNVLLASLNSMGSIPDSSAMILGFPITVLGAVVLFRLGQLLIAHERSAEVSDDSEGGFRARIVHLEGRAAVLCALAGPLLAALGYGRAGAWLVLASLATLGVLAIVSLLQRFFSQVYALFFGRGEDGSDGLVPTLISFLIMVLALPFLALIWGARASDLSELWSKFLAGFSLGETRISPSDFLIFAIVFVIGYTVTRALQGALRTSVLPKTKIDTGGRNAILSGVSYIGIFLAAVVAITAAGIDLSSLAIVAGALSVGIGFGLQTIVSNFVSGIILLVERPISEGDWINAGGMSGIVKKISVRSTRIETFDKTDVIVPNADLIAGQVTNYTKTNMSGRLIVPVGVAYGSDTRRIAEVLQKVAEEHPMVILNPPPQVIFYGFGADSLDFEIRVVLRDVFSIMSVQTEIRHRVAEVFAEEGIEIPFAQRDLWLRNPDALAGALEGGAVLEAPEPPSAGSEAPGDLPASNPGAKESLSAGDLPGETDGDGDGDGGGPDR